MPAAQCIPQQLLQCRGLFVGSKRGIDARLEELLKKVKPEKLPDARG